MRDAELLAAAHGIVKGRVPPRALVSRTFSEKSVFFEEIRHYAYGGDALLHVAAAAHQGRVVKALLDAGADVRARNRRGAEPLHYAADGAPAAAAAETVRLLIAAGADPNALDASGVAPLHRAVRCRVTSAVKALLAGGADLNLRNKNGSKAIDLAKATTGKSGSGSPEAKRAQQEIAVLLAAHR